MSLFTKKIKCLNCNGNFKGIKERGKMKYICSNYSKNRTCVRHVVEESKLVYLVYNHMELQQLKQGNALKKKSSAKRAIKEDKENISTSTQIKEYVSQININPTDKTIEILYMDGSRTFVSSDKIYY